MDPEILRQLETALDGDVAAKHAANQHAAKQIDRAAKNLEDFESKKDSVIRPALNEIVQLHKVRGMYCHVVEREGRDYPDGRSDSPRIGLDLAGPDWKDRTIPPEFSLIFNKQSRKLLLYTSTGSYAGPQGEVALDDLTVDWIQTKYLKFKAQR